MGTEASRSASARARDTLHLLRSLSQERGLTLVASLHDLALAKEHFDRLVGLRRGRIVFDVAVGAVREADLAALYDLDFDERSDLASVGA